MTSELHPPTHEIRVRHTDVNGNVHVQTHFVWSSLIFMKARMEECTQANAKHRQETGEPGKATVQLL